MCRIQSDPQGIQFPIVPLVHQLHLGLGDLPGKEGIQHIRFLLGELLDLVLQRFGAVSSLLLPCPNGLHCNIGDILDDSVHVHLQRRQGLLQNIHGQLIPEHLPDIAAHLISLDVLAAVPLRGGGEAAPASIAGAVLPHLLPGNEAGSALAALNLAAEHIAVGVPAAVVPFAVPFFQLRLHNVPQFSVDDGFVVIPDDHQFLLPMVVLFGVAEIVRGDGLFLHQVAHIFFVFQNLDDIGVGPFCVPGQ